MKGDFSRKTFRKEKHYSSVNMQQGRVQLDADWNEQMDISIHNIRSFIKDFIGDCGGPIDNAGFQISHSSGNDYEIKAGHYYVGGILCENEVSVKASKQPDLPTIHKFLFRWNEVPGDDTTQLKRSLTRKLGETFSPVKFRKTDNQKIVGLTSTGNRLCLTLNDEVKKVLLTINEKLIDEFCVKKSDRELNVFYEKSPALPSEKGTYIAYLDVWERHITALDDPEIRETALGGPDTTTRTKVVWQVKVQKSNGAKNLLSKPNNSLKKRCCCTPSLPESGKMRARTEKEGVHEETIDVTLEGGGYLGLEDQLFRVEIHDGGNLNSEEKPTFKWSRDNGCVVAKVSDISTDKIILGSIIKDQKLSFARDHWVEVTDDRHDLWEVPGTFARLLNVEGNYLLFDENTICGEPLISENFPQKFNPKVRRWDDPKGLRSVEIPSENDGYLPLECGVEVQFQKASYITGNYWLIPARTATTDIMWPRNEEVPKALPPEGVKHHFCPLALLRYSEGRLRIISDCRKFFPPIINHKKPKH